MAFSEAMTEKHWKNGIGYCTRPGSGTATVQLALGQADMRIQIAELLKVLEWVAMQQTESGTRAVCFEVKRCTGPTSSLSVNDLDANELLYAVEGISAIMKRMPQLLVAVGDGFVPNLGVFIYGLCDVVLATPDTVFALAESNMQIPLYFLQQMGMVLPEYILSKGVCMGTEDARQHGLLTSTLSRAALEELQMAPLAKLLAVVSSIGGQRGLEGALGPRCRGDPLCSRKDLAASQPLLVPEATAAVDLAKKQLTDASTTDGSESDASDNYRTMSMPMEAQEAPHPMNLPATCFKSQRSAVELITAETSGFCCPGAEDIDVEQCAAVLKACGALDMGTLPSQQQRPHQQQVPSSWQGFSVDPAQLDGMAKSQEPITSVMIRNIPCRITMKELSQAINQAGFNGLYDFLYMPKGNRRSKARESNLGYAFVNFPDATHARLFMQGFTGFRFPGTKSLKEVEVRPSYLQGAKSMRSFHPSWGESLGKSSAVGFLGEALDDCSEVFSSLSI